MKSLEELKAIRDKMQNQVNLRDEDTTATRIVVGMAIPSALQLSKIRLRKDRKLCFVHTF